MSLITAGVCTSIAPLNTDTAWMLVAARRVLHGARLYVDLMETNPPLIVWLWTGPAALAGFSRLSDQKVAGLAVAALIGGASVLALAVLGRDWSRPRRIWLLSSWLVALVGFCIWDVGQREQLAALLTLPYTGLAATTITARSACVGSVRAQRLPVPLTGLLAGVGFALKPFFLGALIAIELTVCGAVGWRRTVTRLELQLVAAVHAIYALLLVAITPEYLRDMVPAVVATYGAYGNGVEWVLEGKSTWLPALMVIVALASSWLRPMTSAAALTRVTSAANLGWLVGFVAQGKGWRYHLIPVMVFGTLTMAAAAAHLWSVGPILWRRSVKTRLLMLVSTAILLLAAVSVARGARRWALTEWRAWWAAESATEQLARVVSQLAPGDPIYVLSTSMAPAFPLVNLAGAQWPYRYHFLWPLPGLYSGPTGAPIPYRAPAEQGPLERTFFDRVVSDLERTPPRLLIVDRQRDQQGMAHGRPFDFLRYFSASPRFAAVFSHYQRAGAVGPFEVYEWAR